MAYAELDVIIHRSGRPVQQNINIRIIDSRSITYSRGYTQGGRCSFRVPENEMYTVVLDQYRTGNEIRMVGHRGRQSVDFDMDVRQTR